MATKWKYANLDAQERLGLLKEGNKELFDEEVARTKEITKAKRELGLDTTEQENWMDAVGYNYNLSLAGVGDTVSKSGYAKLYLDEKPKTQSTEKTSKYRLKEPSPYISEAKRKINNAQELAKDALTQEYESIKNQAKEELFGRYPYLKEQLINSGASLDGGKAARTYQKLETKLMEIYDELDAELEENLKAVDNKYASLVNTLMEYREKGAMEESMGVIADYLVRNAAQEDGFDANLIPGVKKRINGVSSASEKDNDLSEADDKAVEIVKFGTKESGTDSDEKDLSSADDVASELIRIEEFRNYLGQIFEAVAGNGEKLKTAIGKFLVKSGMSDAKADKIASKLVNMIKK